MPEYTKLIAFNWSFVMILITFLVLLLILKKFFFEKVKNFIEKRELTIKDAFDNAEVINMKADERMNHYNKQIAKLESEGKEIIRQAKIKADSQAKDIMSEANVKIAEMMDGTKREMEKEKEKLLVEMHEHMGELAILIAGKVLEEEYASDEKQKVLVDKIIEEAGKTGWNN